jgi:hypothetical protein
MKPVNQNQVTTVTTKEQFNFPVKQRNFCVKQLNFRV